MRTSGSAGSSLAEIAQVLVDRKMEFLTFRVTPTGAALTDFSFEVAMDEADYTAGTWYTQLTGTEWEDLSKFGEGEESGVDDGGGGKYVNTLGDGETVVIRLRVTGFYAVRFLALGSGATVVMVGGA